VKFKIAIYRVEEHIINRKGMRGGGQTDRLAEAVSCREIIEDMT
jgi:hypothetical protein